MTNLSEMVTTQILAAIPRAGARRPPQLELSLSSAPTCNHFMTVRSYMKVFVSPPRTLSPGSSARAGCSSQVEAIPARIISRRWRCTAGDAPDLNGSSGDDLSGVAPGAFPVPDCCRSPDTVPNISCAQAALLVLSMAQRGFGPNGHSCHQAGRGGRP